MRVSLSLWSMNLGRIADEIERFDSLVASYHVDVADGTFTDALLFGPMAVEVLNHLTDKPIVAHLMVDEPRRWICPFADAGAAVIAFHPSANCNIEATIDAIHDAGARAALALKLDEPDELVSRHLDRITELVVMATPIGVKGQAFDSRAVQRVQHFVADRGNATTPAIFVDGGIRWTSLGQIAAAKADGVVAGSILANDDDPGRVAAKISDL